ncbi:pyridoxamine 5'-phosphate oxidase family protein [Streptacidiphilus rugosus]|uniref:pyridoxamine 5'-phosphate oxidase family protein n=1 Tax=Streptacidiphilus rugosus TaxID=405783 RepID=UPI00056C6923|nr:pyridoxamine 5'-phosphate oxidase family protein [Streptacidiphilus rugosus]
MTQLSTGAAPLPAGAVEVTTEAELAAVLGEPSARDAAKVRTRLHENDRAWLAAAPFCLVSTADAEGNCDASPKGDPAGFTLVLDDTTIVVPERRGNRRADGFRNVLVNPHVGLLYLIPGRGDTLRVNGRARLLRDAPFFDRLVVKGHRPRLALLVEIEEVFYHCSKAFLRSGLWQPEGWAPDAAPSRAVIAKSLERQNEDLTALEAYYGPGYGGDLYGTTD